MAVITLSNSADKKGGSETVDEEGRPVAAVRYHTARDMILLALSLAFFLRSCASMTVPKKMPRQVLAVRHGQSVWNVLRSQYPSKQERYIDALYAPDCDVTEEGVGQSVQAGRELLKALHQDKEGGAVDPNVVFIVSPLRRALQTAQHMLQGGDGDGWQPDQTRVHPLAAEILQDPCDIGTPVEELAQEFPHFDFRLVRKAAASGYWWAYHRSVEETWRRMKGGLTEGVEPPEEIVTRMANLKRYVCEEFSEADVVVLVCHSETIWWLSSRQGSDGSLYGIWTANGEIVDLTDCMRLDKEEERVVETPPALDDRYQRFDVFLT